ncbi:hypothetical protein N657DRAFT_650584 [Parathielavia appendiculata]|uniref:Uncharacterized protein n=1 Tax=Parathielavia appendiculata TaxID=2587402 RepID=A0AAN6TR10_9PEZI|nr:hypothetical protein N657DRAFT_650584 [Parathielavia appendiculata]
MTQARLETSPCGSSNWSDTSNACAWVNLKFVYMLSPKDGSRLAVTLETSRSHLPTQPVQWRKGKPPAWPDMVHGNPDQSHGVDVLNTACFSGVTGRVLRLVGQHRASPSPEGHLVLGDRRHPGDFGRLQPGRDGDECQDYDAGGQCIPYKGLNVDDTGNLYSSMVHNRLTNGEHFVTPSHSP